MACSARTLGFASLLCLVALVAPRRADAQCGGTPSMTLTDGASFTWDVRTDGGIDNGTGDAFDGGMVLMVDGTYFMFAGTGMTELGGRQLAHGPSLMSGLSVTRRVYVPAAEGWARFLEYFDNPTSAPITAMVRIETNPGSDSSTIVTGSSSGDTVFSATDRWVTTDDTTSGGDPSLCHALYGIGGTVIPTSVDMIVHSCAGTEGVAVDYRITVPAGGRVILMHFGSQSSDSSSAMASCTALSALPATTTSDIVATDRAAIVNWSVTGGSSGLPLGAACSSGTQCTSGVCADGVCCDRACGTSTTDCMACSISAGAMVNGVCASTGDCCTTAADCDDGDSCTTDTCVSMSCVSTPIAGCGMDGGRPDGGTGIDAGPGVDAGPRPDGSVTMDSGFPRTDGGGSSRGRRRGGCCSVPGIPSADGTALVLLALALAVLVRRTRRG